MKNIGFPCNGKSEISNVCNAVEDLCLQAIKIVHHHANGRFDWLTSEQQSVNPSREAISILSGKYKRFTLVPLVEQISSSHNDLIVLQLKLTSVSSGNSH